MVDELVFEASCPVCFNILRSPVNLCINGHGFCAHCRSKLVQCPLCTQPFSASTSKNVLLNSVLNLIPHKCRFDGCPEFATSGDVHEKWCGYQPTSCKLYQCGWTGYGKDIRHHILISHKDHQILSENNSKWSYPQAKIDVNVNNPLFAYGHFFWMSRSNIDGKTVTVDFVLVPNEKMTSSFKITLTFGEYKNSFYSTIYVTPENVFNKEWTTMTFGYERLQRRINTEGNLKFSLSVKKC